LLGSPPDEHGTIPIRWRVHIAFGSPPLAGGSARWLTPETLVVLPFCVGDPHFPRLDPPLFPLPPPRPFNVDTNKAPSPPLFAVSIVSCLVWDVAVLPPFEVKQRGFPWAQCQAPPLI